MLTDSQVKKAVSSARADAMLNDGAVGRGSGSLRLKIRAGARGTTATWMAWWQDNGKPKTQALGRYPAMTLADARAACMTVIGSARNPHAVAIAPEARTVGTLFEGYIAAMRADGKSSAAEVEGRLERAAEVLGHHTPAADVDAADIARVLSPIYERGSHVMADRMRAYLSAAFNWGIEATNDYRVPKHRRINWGIKINPAAQTKRHTTASKARERTLSASELRGLWLALDGQYFAPGTASAIRLAICCGQRIMETLRADGADIDLVAGVWTMPARKTKGGKPHALPLPRQAVEIFRQLVERHGKGPLFPGRLDVGERQIATSLNKAMRRWTRANGYDDFQGRDLRRTWKTLTAEAGIDRFMRDLIQQHARGDTGSKHYDRATYMPQLREAMAKWEVWLDNNVVQTQQHKIAA